MTDNEKKHIKVLLAEATVEVDAAVARRNQLLKDARAAGLALRPIAEASGLAVETVRRLTSEEGGQ